MELRDQHADGAGHRRRRRCVPGGTSDHAAELDWACANAPGGSRYYGQLEIWRVAPNGTLTATVEHSYDVTQSGAELPAYTRASAGGLVPLAGGGVAASVFHEPMVDHPPVPAEVRSVGTLSLPTSMSLPGLDAIGAAGEGEVVHAITTTGVDTTTRVLDLSVGAETASYADLVVSAALAGGGVAGLNSTTGLFKTRAATGEVLESASLPVSSARAHVAGRLWVGVTPLSDDVAGYVEPALRLAQSSQPWAGSSLEQEAEALVNRAAFVVNFRAESLVDGRLRRGPDFLLRLPQSHQVSS